MGVWPMRLLGIAIALVAAYLAYRSSNQAAVMLLSSGGAAALAILSVILLWTKPRIGTPLAAVFLVAGIVTPMVLASHSSSTVPFVAASTSGVTMQDGSIAPPQRPLGSAGVNVSDFIGPTVVDDAVATITTSEATSIAGNAALSAFGSNTTAVTKNAGTLFSDPQRRLVESDYDLGALSQSLPNDAAQLDTFVRDKIALDPYSGVLRGALGTWLSGAGGPDDKIVLLSMLLAKHNIDYTIVRGTLSDADRATLLAAAAASRPAPTYGAGDTISATMQQQADTLSESGASFASWLQSQTHFTPGDTSALFGNTHYWIEVKSSSGTTDLDPSLTSLQPGAHLGVLDAGYKAGPFVPADSWFAVQFRVVGMTHDNAQIVYLESTQRSADVQDVPIDLLIAPTGDPNAIAGARTFRISLRVGSKSTNGKQLSLDGSSAPASVFLEVRTRLPNGAIQTHRYRLFDPSTPAAQVPWQLAGTHTYLVENGTVNQTLALNELLKSLRNYGRASFANDPKKLSFYPLLLVSFLGRDDAVAASLARRSMPLLVRTTPSIVAVHAWNAPDGSTPAAFDIVSASRDSASSARGDVVNANLARASGDAAIEAQLIGTPSSNIPALFDPSRAAGTAVQTIDASNARDEMATSLANGDLVVAATGNSTPAAWWEADPKTGNAVARRQGGGGQEMGEEDIDYAEIYEQAWLANSIGKTGYTCAKQGVNSAGCKVAVCAMAVEALFSVAGKPEFSVTRFAGDIGNGLSSDKLCELPINGGGEGSGGE